MCCCSSRLCSHIWGYTATHTHTHNYTCLYHTPQRWSPSTYTSVLVWSNHRHHHMVVNVNVIDIIGPLQNSVISPLCAGAWTHNQCRRPSLPLWSGENLVFLLRKLFLQKENMTDVTFVNRCLGLSTIFPHYTQVMVKCYLLFRMTHWAL